MKKLMTLALAIVALASCSKEGNEGIDANAPVEIKMQASINVNPTVMGKSAGPVNGISSGVTDVAFVRLDGNTPLDWTSLADADVITTTIATDGTIALTNQFYPASGDKANFIGYHPKSNGTLASDVITFKNIDGNQDIMYAPVTSGDKTTPADGCIEPVFGHQLSQLKFTFEADASYNAADTKVTELIIKGTKLPASMKLSDGTMTYAATASDITVFTGKTYAFGAMSEVIMVEAGANAILADIKITENGTERTIQNVAINLTTVIGTAHMITLTFKQKAVSGKASVTPWKTGTGGTGEIM